MLNALDPKTPDPVGRVRVITYFTLVPTVR